MARYRSHPADSVIAQLRREPWRFSLEQCVRLLELSGVSPELRGERGLTFAPAEIGRLQGARVQVRSLGLGGADGVLPYGVLEALPQAAQDFLSLFEQRLIEHDCRSRSAYRLATPYARREQAAGGELLQALCGFLTTSRPAQVPLSLIQSGLLANRRRSAAGFVALAAMMNISVSVEEFAGRWQVLPADAQSRTGCRLGRNSVAGRHAWHQHAGIRLHLIASSAAQWRTFLPGGEGFTTLSFAGRLWFGAAISLELVMRGTLTLDTHLSRARPPRLGRTAQLQGRKASPCCCRLFFREDEHGFKSVSATTKPELLSRAGAGG
ncbi:TPA: type VI secretion system baseplate subunit TssG [Citrobacter farmeri]|uniref:type VI secretion system baseplate subunit TssG n=1 Tax=Citrobacter farmeri TaxID=67824 RepID=UPI001A1E7659|nr:type VI secretion system baseplate subunit TssG [Citrobacter farmeri]MBU5644292.1 type VI secretion system baseplate subunit TssG [Pluralibacter sp. S54_ASV_43]HAT3754331.1 type VI secretion system baseplate subunit TssG [Citrobacter amalonaticus]HAU5705675.1 type VI secretion system baseplate subunit TssG [Citrobacter freundii]QZE48731.1 type VI secretion system baseplate subunit TssG [Citrobacter farmeri]HCB1597063.1 type VI secretion system baseplate subunit TssG [Citrobacter farmeri]